MPPCRVERRHFAMTIGKKLYAGFGLILAILSLLFVVNIIAGWREKTARADAGMALDSVRTVESVRYQIMLNRLNMNNFLLSGDPRDEEKVNKGLTDITDQIKRGESQASSEAVRTALIQVESTESSWGDQRLCKIIAPAGFRTLNLDQGGADRFAGGLRFSALDLVGDVRQTLVHFLFIAGIAAEEKIIHVEAIQHDLIAHGFNGANAVKGHAGVGAGRFLPPTGDD